MENLAPTKSSLMIMKSSLSFSEKGFELLDKKRNVLIREMMNHIDKAEKLQEKIGRMFSAAYKELVRAVTASGMGAVENIAYAIPREEDFEIIFRSVMGVEIPHIKYTETEITAQYGIYKTNSAIDEAYKRFNEVKLLIYELAELENTVYRLAVEIKKTQKRANALENIQIPKLKESIKNISETLEEKEREDFFRLKMIKHKKE